MLADLLGSAGVVVAALLAMAFGWWAADPVAALAIGVLVLIGAWRVLRESIAVLLEATPEGIDADEVGRSMAAVPGVREVHDLHVWTITSGFPALSAHVLVGPGEDCHARRREVAEMLDARLPHPPHDAAGGARERPPAPHDHRARPGARAGSVAPQPASRPVRYMTAMPGEEAADHPAGAEPARRAPGDVAADLDDHLQRRADREREEQDRPGSRWSGSPRSTRRAIVGRAGHQRQHGEPADAHAPAVRDRGRRCRAPR